MSKTFCPSCGEQSNANADYCKNCGARLEAKVEHISVKFCPVCGGSSEANVNYCMYCGARFEEKVGESSKGLLDYDTYIIERNRPNQCTTISDENGNEIGRAINQRIGPGEVTLYDENRKVYGKVIGSRLLGQNDWHMATMWKSLPFGSSWSFTDPSHNKIYEIKRNSTDKEWWDFIDMNSNVLAQIHIKSLKKVTIKMKKGNPLIPILFVLHQNTLVPKPAKGGAITR